MKWLVFLLTFLLSGSITAQMDCSEFLKVVNKETKVSSTTVDQYYKDGLETIIDSYRDHGVEGGFNVVVKKIPFVATFSKEEVDELYKKYSRTTEEKLKYDYQIQLERFITPDLAINNALKCLEIKLLAENNKFGLSAFPREVCPDVQNDFEVNLLYKKDGTDKEIRYQGIEFNKELLEVVSSPKSGLLGKKLKTQQPESFVFRPLTKRGQSIIIKTSNRDFTITLNSDYCENHIEIVDIEVHVRFYTKLPPEQSPDAIYRVADENFHPIDLRQKIEAITNSKGYDFDKLVEIIEFKGRRCLKNVCFCESNRNCTEHWARDIKDTASRINALNPYSVDIKVEAGDTGFPGYYEVVFTGKGKFLTN